MHAWASNHDAPSKPRAAGYSYRAHCLPHDVAARELGTGQSRKAVLEGLLDEPIIVAPLHAPEDGIAAARGLLGASWFDAQACKRGLMMLRGYHRNKMGRPVHGPGPHSHGADALRTAAAAFHLVGAFSRSSLTGGRMRRRLRGLV